MDSPPRQEWRRRSAPATLCSAPALPRVPWQRKLPAKKTSSLPLFFNHLPRSSTQLGCMPSTMIAANLSFATRPRSSGTALATSSNPTPESNQNGIFLNIISTTDAMDRNSRRECMRLIGRICVQYNLPAGDPCWMAETIGRFVTSPLEEAIECFRESRSEHQAAVEQSESLTRPYNGQRWAVYQEILRAEPLKSELAALDVVIDRLNNEYSAARSVLRKFITLENEKYVTRRAYQKCT